MAQCLISFGSNLGHRADVVAEAARRIQASGAAESLTCSRLFETPPIGGPGGQEPFLNAVACFETDWTARQVLALLQETENQLGRKRKARWGARSIDLDVVLHGQLVGGGQGLIVPHPRYTARQFVLRPACDVAAHYCDPRFGWSIRRLADHLDAAPPSLALTAGSDALRQELCGRLADQHGITVFAAPRMPEPMSVVANAPASSRPESDGQSSQVRARERTEAIVDVAGAPKNSVHVRRKCSAPDFPDDRPWVSAFVPPLPESGTLASETTEAPARSSHLPRLVVRLQSATPKTRWPAPHQIWPGGGTWPEYRLEIDDVDWAVGELASAIDSMQCPLQPVTDDGQWW
ncbi:MAG: 2-amino-4-hydroxy-6-hydroxymethyldihydropteridine diphosphokinase [Planctomycetota bacterium]